MRRIILAVAMTVFLSACTFAAPTPTQESTFPPPTPTQESLAQQIDRGEERWQKHGIESYRIEVLSARGTWHAQSHQIVVRSGQVVEASASCIPAPAERGKCEVEPFDAHEYTVPALFARAREKAQIERGERTRITFDPSYGFPSLISHRVPEITDGGAVWRVEAFEALE